MPDADTLNLPQLLDAVAAQITAHSNAAKEAKRAEDAAEAARRKRNAATTALYELRDQASNNAPARGAVQAMLREAGISLPPSRRSA